MAIKQPQVYKGQTALAAQNVISLAGISGTMAFLMNHPNHIDQNV